MELQKGKTTILAHFSSPFHLYQYYYSIVSTKFILLQLIYSVLGLKHPKTISIMIIKMMGFQVP